MDNLFAHPTALPLGVNEAIPLDIATALEVPLLMQWTAPTTGIKVPKCGVV